MSYAPIYSKLTDLDTRLSILELSAKSAPAPVPTPAQAPVPVPVPDYANTVVAPYAPDSSAEISGIREEINNLLKECVVNTSAINLLSLDIASLATKDELTALATKGEEFALATKGELAVVATLATKEELATLATKDELATLATKEELAEVSTKFENILAVLSQLNTKIIEATDRITAIESSSSA